VRDYFSGRHSYGRENCRTVKHLQGVLRLSGRALLDISASELSEEMARILVSEQWRWEQLRFYNKEFKSLSKGSKILFKVPKEPLNLKKVELYNMTDIGVARWVEAARPQHLRLVSCDMTKFCPITWWSNLQALLLNGNEESLLHGPSVHAILATVRLHLIELSIIMVDFEGIFTEIMEFPELRNLQLLFVSHWWMILAPNVVSLRLEPVESAPKGTIFKYTQLKELVYRADKAPLLSDTFHSPQLVSISMIAALSTNPGENLVWSTAEGKVSSMAAKEISIEGDRGIKGMNYKDVLESLRPHTGLEKLKLVYLKFPILFYKAFLRKGSKKTSLLCPALRELEVDMKHIRNKVDASQYDQLFRKITQERAESGSPLIRFYVTWPGYEFEPTDYTKGEALAEEKFSINWDDDSSDDSDRYPYDSSSVATDQVDSLLPFS
jgi:hypothetical protein